MICSIQTEAVVVYLALNSWVHVLALSFLPTVLICMLVRTMHVVAENMGPLEVMVMCSHPSKHPFTLVVRSSDGTAVGEQMNELYKGMQVATYVCTYVSY